jgi:hypothetical protein
VRGFGSFYLRGQSLWRGFLRGLSFLIVDYGYPLFRHPTAGMRVGLKSFVISRTTGLYGLKFAKSSALAGDFLT